MATRRLSEPAEDPKLSAAEPAITSVASNLPPTARGQRTRKKMLDSARRTFETSGYGGARIVDMAEGAGTALGTFYRYFEDKNDVLAELLENVNAELYEAARAPYLGSDEPEEILRGSIRRYMEVYAANAAIMRVSVEAATADERFTRVWFETRSKFLVRVVSEIERSQQAGLIPLRISPVLQASALSGMLWNFCWIWFSMGGERLPEQSKPTPAFDEMVDVMVTTWTNALFR